MEYVLLKIEGVNPERLTVLYTIQDLPVLYAERDRLMEANGHKLTECRYAVRLAPGEKLAQKEGKQRGKGKST